MSLYLGIDLGTTKIALLVYDPEVNAIRTGISFPHKALRVNGPYQEIDPEKIARMVLNAMQRLPHRREIKAIGISTQMHGCLLVDERNRPLSPLITWQDERCLQPHPVGSHGNYLERIRETVGGNAFRDTGTDICSGFLGPTVFWLSEQKQLPRKSRVCFLGDYLAALLTGAPVSPDITNAGSSGFYDIRNKKWLGKVITTLGIPPEVFPEVGEPGSVLGTLTPGQSALTGLPGGVQVLRAFGDNQASALGAAGDLARTLLVTIGTGSAVSLKTDAYVRRSGLDTRYFLNGSYILVGAALCGGRALADFVQFLTEAGRFTTRKPSFRHAETNRLLKNYTPPASGMVCGPFFAGTRAEPGKTGFLMGIREDNFHVREVIASVMEGMIFELYGFAGQFGRTDYAGITGCGNAMRKNPYLGRVTAHLFNTPVRITRFKEEAALGACFLAVRASEKSFNMQEALAGGYEKMYSPSPVSTAVYRQLYARYKACANG